MTGRYEILDDIQETPGGGLLRHGVRSAARAGEAALGIPGDLANLALSGVNLAHKGITGEWSPGIENAQKANPLTTEKLRQNVTEPIAKKLGADITPHNEYEQVADRFVSEVASILTPTGVLGALGKGAKLGSKAVKGAVAASGLGNLAGFATKKWTGSELAGDVVHGITMLGTSLGLNGGMKKHAGQMYDTSKEIGKDIQLSTNPLIKGVTLTEDLLEAKAATKGGKALGDFLDKSAKKMANRGFLTGVDAIDLNQGLNKVVSQNPSIAQDAPNALNSIRKAIDTTLKQAHNPDFYNTYKGADALYRETHKASRIQDFIKDISKSTHLDKGAAGILVAKLFGIGSHYIPDIATMAPGAAVLGGIYGLGSLIKRIPGLSDPTIKRYYVQAIKAAANESRPGVIKALHGIEKYARGKDLGESIQNRSKPARWERLD
jgi:hypothetical protein